MLNVFMYIVSNHKDKWQHNLDLANFVWNLLTIFFEALLIHSLF